MPELNSPLYNCTKDLVSNASSTWVGIAVGAAIGLAITWWIYNRQKKISDKQDIGLRHIEDLEKSHERILKSIEELQKHQERILSQILSLDKNIDLVLENKDT